MVLRIGNKWKMKLQHKYVKIIRLWNKWYIKGFRVLN